MIFPPSLSSPPSQAEGAAMSPPGIRSGLQPRLRAGHALLEGGDRRRLLEGEPDVVEALEQARAIGSRQLEGEIGSARAAYALSLQIDREWRGAIGRKH